MAFSLAGVELGSASGQAIITPVDLVPGEDSTAPSVLNIARFLQSLDVDGNLSNGIQLSEDLALSVDDYMNQHQAHVDFADTAAFELLMDDLLTHLHQDNAFTAPRTLRTPIRAWQHMQDHQDTQVDFSKIPVLFAHGGAGSASQFESQAQRFIANGYPRSYLAAFEWPSSTTVVDYEAIAQDLDVAIDALRQATGFDQIHLMGHSRGTELSQTYLLDSQRAAKVARYVSLDGREIAAGEELSVPALALWGQYIDRHLAGATNVYPPAEDPVGHIEVATSLDSFERMYRFFNDDKEPGNGHIPRAEGEHVWISGRAINFPENTGAAGPLLEITRVDAQTGHRLSTQPDYTHQLGTSGEWGPVRITAGGSYEFALRREAGSGDQYFYREPFNTDNHQIRLNTSPPGSGVTNLLARSPHHTNLSINRDMEMWGWGDEGENDVMMVSGVNVITPQTGAFDNRLSIIFLHDRNSDGNSNLAMADPVLNALPFMSGLDYVLPASPEGSNTINVELTSRRGGTTQVINVPNWPSDDIRSISVHFRDFAE